MKAIILAAGRGSRLENLTENLPKPFVKVNGTPIILNTLNILDSLNISEVILAVGYMADYFRKEIGDVYKNIKITYVENEIWDKTNNSYSLYLCKKELKKDEKLLIFEADVFFNNKFFKDGCLEDENNYWFCDEMFFTGSQIFENEKGNIEKILIIRDEEKLKEIKSKRVVYKSSGTVKLNSSTAQKIFSELEKFVSDPENVNYYYDVFFNSIIEDLRILPLTVEENCWFEIDTQEDLAEAERVVVL